MAACLYSLRETETKLSAGNECDWRFVQRILKDTSLGNGNWWNIVYDLQNSLESLNQRIQIHSKCITLGIRTQHPHIGSTTLDTFIRLLSLRDNIANSSLSKGICSNHEKSIQLLKYTPTFTG